MYQENKNKPIENYNIDTILWPLRRNTTQGQSEEARSQREHENVCRDDEAQRLGERRDERRDKEKVCRCNWRIIQNAIFVCKKDIWSRVLETTDSKCLFYKHLEFGVQTTYSKCVAKCISEVGRLNTPLQIQQNCKTVTKFKFGFGDSNN